MTNTVFHISGKPNITRFEPRPAPSSGSGQTGNMVWAVGSRLLHNYLLPRDCPRVTFYARPGSLPEDVERLMGYNSASHVVAIESRWLPEVMRQRLYMYELPAATFHPVDEGADYYISREAVLPQRVTLIDDILGALLQRNVELRVMPSLWKLHDAVASSTLRFSIIRMRNAQPRTSGTEAYKE